MSFTESDLEVVPRTYDSPTISVAEQDLRELLYENARLRKQVDELQKEASATANNSRSRRVRAFHQRFGHPVAWSPTVPPEERVRFRVKLIAEEFKEFLLAIFDDPDEHSWGDYASIHEAIEGAFAELEDIRLLAPIKVDMVEAMDALEDMDYVVEGTRAEFGVESEPLAAEVQRANMSKGANGSNGKPVKPAGWTPPDIRGCLIAQGWTPTNGAPSAKTLPAPRDEDGEEEECA